VASFILPALMPQAPQLSSMSRCQQQSMSPSPPTVVHLSVDTLIFLPIRSLAITVNDGTSCSDLAGVNAFFAFMGSGFVCAYLGEGTLSSALRAFREEFQDPSALRLPSLDNIRTILDANRNWAVETFADFDVGQVVEEDDDTLYSALTLSAPVNSA
jgi:hypothetical protein